jgi:hypothetical protein
VAELLELAPFPDGKQAEMERQETEARPLDEPKREKATSGSGTYKTTITSKALNQATPQLLPLQKFEMPMNLRAMRVIQKMGSMQFRMRLALRLFHLANRRVCSARS